MAEEIIPYLRFSYRLTAYTPTKRHHSFLRIRRSNDPPIIKYIVSSSTAIIKAQTTTTSVQITNWFPSWQKQKPFIASNDDLLLTTTRKRQLNYFCPKVFDSKHTTLLTNCLILDEVTKTDVHLSIRGSPHPSHVLTKCSVWKNSRFEG